MPRHRDRSRREDDVTLREGIHADIPMDVYVNDPAPEPSLSTTTAKLLLSRSPLHAWWAHPKLGGHRDDDSSRADLGSAVHAFLFGGALLAYAPAEFTDWRKKDAQTFRDGARERGEIPLLAHQRQEIEDMAGPARERLASLGVTENERTMIWKDGVWCRSRPDIMTEDRSLVVDYKTTTNADPAAWIRSTILSGGYDLQAGLVLRGLNHLVYGTDRREFLFLVQEIEPPHCVSVVGLGPEFLDLAARKVDAAIDRWAECLRLKRFPGYDERTHYADPPTWALMDAEVMS